jgi:hypothetical protein
VIEKFLEEILKSKALARRVEQFDCKSDCPRCGNCVNLAAELGLDISAYELVVARQQFADGRLVVGEVEYNPDPIKVQQSRIRRSVQTLLRNISEIHKRS